jgi:2-methylisocitrate lyase-like PEP mutase family enzyme
MAAADDRRERFRRLHEHGTFVMANAWDRGSARLLAASGFPALATTSAGFAWTLGAEDHRATRDQLVEHVAALAGATELPLSVDSERLFAGTPAAATQTVGLLAEAGAAGCSVEDFDPDAGAIVDVAAAVEFVAAAAEAARRSGVLLTARAENLLHGVDDLADTIGRLCAYRDAGADVVFAPGLRDAAQIAQVVEAVRPCPVSVLVLPGVPPVAELAALGVRRVSTGGALASRAYAAGLAAARSLLADGVYPPGDALSPADRAAFS